MPALWRTLKTSWWSVAFAGEVCHFRGGEGSWSALLLLLLVVVVVVVVVFFLFLVLFLVLLCAACHVKTEPIPCRRKCRHWELDCAAVDGGCA